jgi:hypothetical protein
MIDVARHPLSLDRTTYPGSDLKLGWDKGSRSMRRWVLAVAAAALLVTGCSGSGQSSTPSSTPASDASGSAPTPASSSGQPSAAVSPGAGGSPSGAASGAPCQAGQPAGTYTLTSFAGQSQSGLGRGAGGDITVSFTEGSYRMVAKGDEPMIMQVQDQARGKLFVKGTIDGSYDKTGAIRTFTVSSEKGTAYLTNADGRADLDFRQLTKVIGLDGKFALACQGDRLALAGEAAVFSLVRA